MSISIYDNLPTEKFGDAFDATAKGGIVRKGEYHGTIKFANEDAAPAEQWDEIRNAPGFFYTNIVATVNGGGPFDGAAVRGFLSTKPFKAGRNTNKVTTSATRFLVAVGETDKAVAADDSLTLARTVTEVIGETGVPAKFFVDWTAQCRGCQERGVDRRASTVRGEENFNTDDAGNPIPKTACPTCTQPLVGQAEFRVIGA